MKPKKIIVLWFQCLFSLGVHNVDFRRMLEQWGSAIPMSTSRHGHLQMAGGLLRGDGVEREEEGQRSQICSIGRTSRCRDSIERQGIHFQGRNTDLQRQDRGQGLYGGVE